MELRGSGVALLALGVPVIAGILWQSVAGAPAHFPLVNGVALIVSGGLILSVRAPGTIRAQRIIAALLIGLMLAPLITGPVLFAVGDHPVSRWLPLGPLSINAGMLAVPAIAVLAAKDQAYGPFMLGAALVAALLQPDASSGFALTFAAVGLHHVTRDWRLGLTAILGFFASIRMALRGELEPVRFVERVLHDALIANWPAGLALALAWMACFVLLQFVMPAGRAARFAITGTLFGMIVTSLMSHYPSPLIGYGAAPILGFGLAIGFALKRAGSDQSGG